MAIWQQTLNTLKFSRRHQTWDRTKPGDQRSFVQMEVLLHNKMSDFPLSMKSWLNLLNWVNDCNKQVPCLSANQVDKLPKIYIDLTIYPNSILDIFAWMMDHRPHKKCDASANLQIETTQFNDCDSSAQSTCKSHEYSHLLASRISSSSMRLCSAALSLMCCSAR